MNPSTEAALRATIIIEGLPPGVSVQGVARKAEDYGRLSRVVVEHNGAERRPEAICWITFARRTDVFRAIQELDGHVAGGRRVATPLAMRRSETSDEVGCASVSQETHTSEQQ